MFPLTFTHLVRILGAAPGILASALAAAPAPSRPVVLTTNTVIADMTREIAGDDVQVQCLVPPGADLHGFDPTPRDIAPLLVAHLVVANGAGFEPWLDRFLAASGYAGPVAMASDGCTLITRPEEETADAHGHAHDEAEGHAHRHNHADPHAWHDPACGLRYVANIREALCSVDPGSAENYRRRARLYSAQLEALDTWARRHFALVPPGRKRIVTAHDSLAYFGRAYGLEIIPLRGLDTRAEPDARHVAALVEELRAHRVSALFPESVTPSRMIEQLARDAGAVVGGELLTDSVAPAGSAGDSYLGMLRENTLRILAAIEAAPVVTAP